MFLPFVNKFYTNNDLISDLFIRGRLTFFSKSKASQVVELSMQVEVIIILLLSFDGFCQDPTTKKLCESGSN